MRSPATLADTPAVLGTTWALARTAVAAAGLVTLLANSPSSLAITAEGFAGSSRCRGVAAATVACLNSSGEYTWGAHLVLIALFGAVVSGAFPAITGLVHPYAALSLLTALSTADGGEQAALVFSVLAVPVCLADPRRSHWSVWPGIPGSGAGSVLRRSTIHVFLLVIKIQVCVIYLHAGVAKLAVPEWADGTAVYYWTVDGYLPPPTFAQPLVSLVAATPVTLLLATYATLALELALAAALLVHSWRVRALLLVTAVVFHLLIGVTFAIWSFAITMVGLVALLLSPVQLSDWGRACAGGLRAPRLVGGGVGTVPG